MTTADPFAALHAELAPQSALRDAITAATRRPEAQALAPLLEHAGLRLYLSRPAPDEGPAVAAHGC